MNENLQKQITTILQQAIDAAQHGGQWLAGQIPDVLHQLLVWNIAIGAVSLLVEVAAVIAFLWGVRKAWAWDEDLAPPVGLIGGMATVLISLFMISNAIDGLKALVAPKLFLLEYTAHLVK